MFREGLATSWGREQQGWSAGGGPLVSTLPDLVSTHCPKLAQKVVMRNQWSPMGPGKSDEHPLYEELTFEK
ncbi:hypothetical protein Taro_029799 [Colocasia esculenta]|uniref:Uncharacterized protein n=1 Tax=Colocasia esculenta TaxID=4460 RepID=A0A843VU92_COLES|nr:hypothetical protein [Colocasia esculenta]